MKKLLFILFLVSDLALAGVTIRDADEENAPLVRLKTSPLGWVFQAYGIEFESCVLGSLKADNYDGTAKTGTDLKLYKADGSEITTQAEADTSCVETHVDFHPPHDFEIIGGFIALETRPTSDFNTWVVVAPDIPAGSGGSIEMSSNLNMRYMPDGFFRVDGRVTKRMTYNATTKQSKMRLVIKTEPGFKDKGTVVYEIYKP
jgi:hypothetical protein